MGTGGIGRVVTGIGADSGLESDSTAAMGMAGAGRLGGGIVAGSGFDSGFGAFSISKTAASFRTGAASNGCSVPVGGSVGCGAEWCRTRFSASSLVCAWLRRRCWSTDRTMSSSLSASSSTGAWFETVRLMWDVSSTTMIGEVEGGGVCCASLIVFCSLLVGNSAGKAIRSGSASLMVACSASADRVSVLGNGIPGSAMVSIVGDGAVATDLLLDVCDTRFYITRCDGR